MLCCCCWLCCLMLGRAKGRGYCTRSSATRRGHPIRALVGLEVEQWRWWRVFGAGTCTSRGAERLGPSDEAGRGRELANCTIVRVPGHASMSGGMPSASATPRDAELPACSGTTAGGVCGAVRRAGHNCGGAALCCLCWRWCGGKGRAAVSLVLLALPAQRLTYGKRSAWTRLLVAC